MIKRYVDHTGGQNNQVNQFLQQDNESTLIKNASTDVIGAIQRGPGYSDRNSAIGTDDVLGLAQFNESDGTKHKLMATGTDIYTDSGTAWVSSKTGLTASGPRSFDVFLNSIFSGDGTNDNLTFDGSSWSTSLYLGKIPKVSLFHNWHESQFAAGNTDKKSRVWQSDKPQGDKLTWGWVTGSNLATTSGSPKVTSTGAVFKDENIKPGDTLRITSGANKGDYIVRVIVSNTEITLATNFVSTSTGLSYEAGSNWFEVGQDDGDFITAIGENSDRILVFKNNSLYRFDGSSVMKIIGLGVPTKNAVSNIKKWTLFSNRQGIFAYDGVDAQPVSKKLEKYFKAIPQANLVKMVSWSEGDLYRVYIGTVTVDEKTITNCIVNYDLSQNNFTVSSFPDEVRAVADFIDTEDQIVFGNQDGQVFNLGLGNTYGGVPIDFEWITKLVDLDDPEDIKQVNSIIIFGNKLEGVTVGSQVDGGRIQTLSTLQGVSQRVNCQLVGRRFRLLFGYSGPSTPVLEGFSFDFEVIGER